MITPPSPHVCARCAKCCVIAQGDEDIIFPLFQEEIDRLHSVSPLTPPVALQATTQKLQDAMLRLFPEDKAKVRELLPVGGQHHRLAVTDTGHCVFLGEQGCVLPQDVRPAHCLLFPMWLRKDRLVPLQADCLALQEARTTWDLLRALDLSEAGLRDAFSRLRRSWTLCN